MKKLLIAVVLAAVLVLALATTVLADNGPHGNFAASTDACASCHRAHTAQGKDFLLISGDIYLLCTNCHDGSGAYTNVVDGVYQASVAGLAAPYGTQGDANQGLFGGGFENAAMNTTRLTTNGYTAGTYPVPTPVTSHHDVSTATAGTVWGAGNLNAPNTATLTLECTSCHDPHGKAGHVGGTSTGTPIASYRLLRFNPTGSNGYEVTPDALGYFTKAGVTQTGATGGVFIADVAPFWYTVNTNTAQDPSVAAFRHRVGTPWWAYVNAPGDYAGRTYVYERPAFQISTGVGDGTVTQVSCAPVATGVAIDASCAYTGNPAAGSVFNNTVPMGNLGYWCATCHDRYLAGSSARSTVSGDSVYMYRHATTSVACVNCHTAHGATSVMTSALAQGATLNNVQAATNPNTGATGIGADMLKLNNRGLCADCHGSDVGFSTSVLVTP